MQAGMLQHTCTVDLQLQKRGMQGVRRLFCSAMMLMLIDLVRVNRQVNASNMRPAAVGRLSSIKQDVTPASSSQSSLVTEVHAFPRNCINMDGEVVGNI